MYVVCHMYLNVNRFQNIEDTDVAIMIDNY